MNCCESRVLLRGERVALDAPDHLGGEHVGDRRGALLPGLEGLADGLAVGFGAVVGRFGHRWLLSVSSSAAPSSVSARRCAILRRSVQRHGSLPDDRGPGGRFLAAVGRAGARVRGARRPGAVSLRPLPRARGRPSRARRARRVDDAGGARRRDHHPAPGDARLARDLPAPVDAGQGRRDRRPRLGRPGGARSRRRLARARARGLRVPVPADTRADGRPRGAAAGDPGLVVGRAVHLRRRPLHPARARRPAQAGAAPAPADHHRRQRRAAQRRARRALRRRVQHRRSRRPPRWASAWRWSSARARRPAASRCRSRS